MNLLYVELCTLYIQTNKGCPYLPSLPSLPTLVPSLVLKEVLYMYIEGWYKFNPYLPSLVELRYVQSINTISLVLRNPHRYVYLIDDELK